MGGREPEPLTFTEGREGSEESRKPARFSREDAKTPSFITVGGRDGIQSTRQHTELRDNRAIPRRWKQLLAAGCKPNARFFGFDPLSVAQSIKCQQLVELLEAAIPPKPPARKNK
jgi:hypothetical protein